MHFYKKEEGFTLIELSIVIVIIGLIVAGIISGQALVKQSQLRSVVSDQEKIKSAINAFRLQYNAIPGDFAGAADYWNVATCGGASAADCNGDGDKAIESVAAAQDSESFRAWKHLEVSKLFPGSFTGSGPQGIVGDNIPSSKRAGVGITLVYDDSDVVGDFQNGTQANLKRNVILFGKADLVLAGGAAFTTAEGKSIDEKVDDGSPLLGSVFGGNTPSATILAGQGCSDGGNYNVDVPDEKCNIAFSF